MQKQTAGFIETLYAFWASHMHQGEALFYQKAVEKAGGKALELACAAGRLLLVFLKQGLEVEGVESSPDMVKRLRERAEKMGVTPKIYEQKIESVEIRHKYHLLYIPLGSFQFIASIDDVRIALLKYYNLLSEGGELIIPLALPLKEMVTRESDKWVIVSDVKDSKRKERLVKREENHYDLIEQTLLSRMRIELWNGPDLLELQEKEIHMRWYTKIEFESLLKEAGFRSVVMQRSYNEEGPIIPSFMLFIATK